MKYVILLLLSLSTTFTLYAQNANDEVVIPGKAIKEYCLRKFDTNKDGTISKQEAAQVKEFYLIMGELEVDTFEGPVMGEFEVDTFEGLEYFYNLEEIIINHCQAIGFDARPFKKLKVLRLSGDLKEVYLEENELLEDLCIHSDSLRLLCLHKNKALRKLNLKLLSLNHIDLSIFPHLKELTLKDCKLPRIDLSHNPELVKLELSNNELTTIDLTANINLESLYIDSNSLTSLNVSSNEKLDMLTCRKSGLSSLNVSNAPLLTFLNCEQNKLTKLNLSNNRQLKILYAKSNPLRFADIKLGAIPGEELKIYIDIPEEQKSTVKVISPDYGFKGFTVNEKGELASYSGLYHAQEVHHFNIIPFEYNGKYYAWATLKDANYRYVIIDEEGNYAPAFNGIYKTIERCFHVPVEEGRWFYVEDLEGNSYFQNMEGERKMENILDVNPYRKGNAIFGYMIVPAGGQDGVLDLMTLEWKVKPQSSFAFNDLNYASKKDISCNSHLPYDRDKALIYILVKDKKNKMFYMDLDGNRYSSFSCLAKQ